jgi:hypothetical protein
LLEKCEYSVKSIKNPKKISKIIAIFKKYGIIYLRDYPAIKCEAKS